MSERPEIDHEALRARYAAERDKRIRPNGAEQYLEPTGRFASLVEDPYVTRVEREPVNRQVTLAIIGAGFAGLAAGARAREAGIDDLMLIEGAGDVGGAWYWNRYPGAMCDTAAMVYLPLLEETGYMPSAKYTGAAENFAHAQRIATTFDLYEGSLFSTNVVGLDWDEDTCRWQVFTDRGDTIHARFVAMGPGPLHRPKLPGIEGIESFGGHAFHTSRWDYSYTGGDAAGAPMVGLANKRVGIIGTGATSVQAIPHLARDAQELLVFQRTPSSIDVRNNREIDADWFESLEPGWQQEWLTNFATLQTGGFADEDLVQDGWTDIAKRIRDRVVSEVESGAEFTPELVNRVYQDSDDEKMTEIRARVDAIVADEATADALKPWYRQLCKRPCFHDEYLQAFNEPGVRLLDTDGQGVERIDETGVWVGDEHYPVDCLIFASGFEFGGDMNRRAGFETVGRDGLTLSDHWKDGMRSLHGIQVHQFPNLFILGLEQGAMLFSNVTQNLTESATTIASVLARADELGAVEVEPTAAAEGAWVDLISSGETRVFNNPDCTPGYYNNEGQGIDRRRRLNGGYPAGPLAYFLHIGVWRNSGEFDGVEFRTAAGRR